MCALHGSEAQIRAAADVHENGGDWTTALAPRTWCCRRRPAIRSIRWWRRAGRLPGGGLLFDVAADCFRHEPSRALNRLQSFRMREFVRIGTPEEIAASGEHWMARAQQLAAELGAALQRSTWPTIRSSAASGRSWR